MTIGGAFSAVAESMRSSPGLLAVMIVSLGWAALTYLGVQNTAIREHEERIAIYERCWPRPDQHGPVAFPGLGGAADPVLRTEADLLLDTLQRRTTLPEVQQSRHAAALPTGIWGAP